MWSTFGVYAHIVVSIGNEVHKSSSALAVTIITLEVVECRLIFLGGGWPDELGSLVIQKWGWWLPAATTTPAMD